MNLAILLYDTDNLEKTQAYDCIYYDESIFNEYINPETTQTVKYCIRSNDYISINRNYNRGCSNDGVLISFEKLKQLNINIEELLKWNTSIDIIDQYQAYLRSKQITTENFICNCTKSDTFGILCEYQLSHQTFEETIKYQFNLKKLYPIGSQLFGNTTCYNTSFKCDYGKRCLDWRQICDYKQQCIDGRDEDYCEDLLFNECNSDTEYRCRNGMCIDEEYFLDGDIDCQDRSDEQIELLNELGNYCSFIPNMECDERIPYGKEYFSCGDGELIYERALSFIYIHQPFCQSFRDKQWLCEFDTTRKMWTNPENGHCLDIIDNTTDILEQTDCIFLIKCALTGPMQHHSCPCRGNNCRPYFFLTCNLEKTPIHFYPYDGVFVSFVRTGYDLILHDFNTSVHPDYYIFIHSIKCNSELRAIPDDTYWITFYNIRVSLAAFPWQPFEYLFCEMYQKKNPNQQINIHCWNDKYPNQAIYCSPEISFHCISKKQITDGILDCQLMQDELLFNSLGNCTPIEKHRFRCPQFKTSCFTVLNIRDGTVQCSPIIFENSIYETKKDLKDRRCKSKGSDDCQFIRQYIAQSSITTNSSSSSSSSNTTAVKNIEKAIKFWSYCDSIWDMDYGIDEIDCYQWKCHPDFSFYQCKTGQCIPIDWLCNGEWDCSDGSDEEGFQLLTEHTLSDYNFKIFQNINSNLNKQKEKCLTKSSQRSFLKFCDPNFEYPCLLANVLNPLNFILNRPCINLTKLGDGYIDCYGGLDERNLLNCSSRSQLGFNFKCENSNECIPAIKTCLPEYRCSKNENRFLCFYSLNYTQINNNTLIDLLIDDIFFGVYCLDGSYKPNARCNQEIDCQFGEDEFYCGVERKDIFAPEYRKHTYNATGLIFQVILPNYMLVSYIFNKDKENYENDKTNKSNETLIEDISEMILHPQEKARQFSKEGWICNRGILVWKNSSNNKQLEIQCFCPPSYYGQWCQWMSDRITIHAYFQSQTNHLSKGVIKILALFLVKMNNQITILDHYEYHFIPTLEHLNKKQKFYFVYPRPHQLRLNLSSYSIRFEAYLLNDNETIELLAVWIYSIPFHFLPSQRLAKVLKYISQPELNINHTCLFINNSCAINGGKCYPFMNKLNDINSYWCECPNGSYGSHCQFKDQSCLIKTPCSSTSLCRPKYDDNGEKPLCICSINSYGPGCHLHRYCQLNKNSNPCLNGGKCLDNYHHYNSKNLFFCQCPQNYFGFKCEQESGSIEMMYQQSLNSSINEIPVYVIQLFDINTKQDLLLRKQIVYNKNLPFHSKIIYQNYTLPIFGLIKLYTNKSFMRYYLLYTTTINQRSFNLTIILNEKNYCLHTLEIYNKTFIRNLVARYHTLCDRNNELLCFHDENYICLCDINNYTQCFVYNQKWDQCSHCLNQGDCIGDETILENYSCLCPKCYYGERCQYNTNIFSFTLDSLFRTDLLSSSIIKQKVSFVMYILIPSFLFLYGIVNNLFSFVTFRRPKPRLNGIGYYLLMSSIISQISLLFLIIKIIYILIGIQGLISATIFNLILCKILSFSLSSSTRIYYWLASLVTMERLYVTKYPKGMWFKQPKIAKRIILLLSFLTLSSHVHELIKYTIVDNHTYVVNETWCVTEYNQSLKIYDQTNTFIHYIIPFIINFICTIYLTILIVRSRASIDKKKTSRQIFYEHIKKRKEIFVPSIMVIFSALPQLIISFSLACTDLDIRWERYLFIITYFISYTPQILTFHLYVQTSSFFLTEFYLTDIGSTLKERMNIK